MTAARKIEVQIEMIPTEGDPTTTTVSIEPKVPLRDVLASAGISSEGKDFTVNGKAATLDTPVATGSKVSSRDRAVQVRGQERPRGS